MNQDIRDAFKDCPWLAECLQIPGAKLVGFRRDPLADTARVYFSRDRFRIEVADGGSFCLIANTVQGKDIPCDSSADIHAAIRRALGVPE